MDNDNIPKKRLTDTDTGEFIELFEGDVFKVIRAKQKTAIKKSIESKKCNEEIKELNEELGGFVFVLFKYGDTIMNQHPEINAEDLTKLFYLATYVDFNGYIVFNESYITKSQLKEKLKLSTNTFDNFFYKMKNIGIILQDDNKNIKINKEYFTKGEIDKEIVQYFNHTRIYIKPIRYLFENVSSRRHKYLGNYFKIIPYIHRQQSVLCFNPNSKDDIKLMQVKDLQNILNCNANSARNFINELLETKLINGESILLSVKRSKNEGESFIIVNPNIVYGGNYMIDGGRNSIVKWFSPI